MGSTSEDILEEAVPLVLIMLLGYVCARLRPQLFSTATLIGLNRFVYNVAIPCTVFAGLGIHDFNKLNWRFVGLFVIIRVLSAAGIATVMLFLNVTKRTRISKDALGRFLTYWIGTTWVNTIIFGIPMLRSLYGPQVAVLNILAAMGSLFFQFPTMLVLYELRDYSRLHQRPEALDVEGQVTEIALDQHFDSTTGSSADIDLEIRSDPSNTPSNDPDTKHQTPAVLSTTDAGFEASSRPPSETFGCHTVARLVLRTLSNPPLAGILLGLSWSLLARMAADEKRCPYWLFEWPFDLGRTVSPVASFTIGMFMAGREKAFLASWRQGLVMLLVKFLLLPLLTLGLALQLDFDQVEGRSAVLISALPVAVASFSIASKYSANDNEVDTLLVSGQVIVGSILMAPVFLGWNAVLEHFEVFGNEINPPFSVVGTTTCRLGQ